MPDSMFKIDQIQGEPEESQRCLSAIFSTVQVGILIIDAATHTIVDINPEAAAIIGDAPDRIVGSTCHGFICPVECGACPITDLGQCIDKSERKLRRADGALITIVKTVARVNLRGREHLVESFVDISDRIRAEEALKQSEERYRDLLDNADDLIQSVGPDGSFLYVNHAWKKTLGYTDREIASLKVFDVTTPSSRPHCSLLFQQIMSGRPIPRVEVQFTAKDGTVVELEGSINCSFVDGKPQATRGIFRDITERKSMELDLAKSEERYRLLVEDAPEAIFVHCQGRFLYANREAVRLLGVNGPEQLVGESVLSFCHPDYQQVIRERMQQGVADAESNSLELKLVRPDGRVIEVESVGTSIRMQGMPATQVCLHDITKRRQHEKDQEEWNRKLEMMVQEKTRHLQEAQAKLVQSEKMLTLGEVIAGASHELNNPLAGVLCAVQLLRKPAMSKLVDPDFLEGSCLLESMESAIGRCQKIVQDLVRFSTQSVGQFRQLDLNQLLKDALEIMGEPCAEAGIKVSWSADPELPAIEGEFAKLLEVFVSLLKNAKSAVDEGGTIAISSRLVQDGTETPKVVICVRDNGCGIPAQILGKVFDPFFTTRPVGEGPGLGLTVSYGVVKRHGGDIDLVSTPGKGTEVTVTLPVKQPEGSHAG